MISTRIRALFFVLLLIGSLSCVGIVITAWLGPMSTHGTNVLHVGGFVTHVGPGKDFEFETDAGVKLDFICGNNCQASLRHLIRHVKEKAHTDVYYILGPDQQLLVVNAD